MLLPGRLRTTTLGDVLGALHRSQASGTLELEESGPRIHHVHLAGGLVTAVEIDRATPSLAEILRREEEIDGDTLRRSLLRAMASRRLHGDVLVRDFHLSPDVVDRALRRQLMLRLQALEDIVDAQLSFRVTVRPPRGALIDQPLARSEFLAGRRRSRDRGNGRRHPGMDSVSLPGGWDPARARAFRSLGLPFNADATEVKQAYRRLVRSYHPDLHPDASHDDRRTLSLRFAEITAAYRALVA